MYTVVPIARYNALYHAMHNAMKGEHTYVSDSEKDPGTS